IAAGPSGAAAQTDLSYGAPHGRSEQMRAAPGMDVGRLMWTPKTCWGIPIPRRRAHLIGTRSTASVLGHLGSVTTLLRGRGHRWPDFATLCPVARASEVTDSLPNHIQSWRVH